MVTCVIFDVKWWLLIKRLIIFKFQTTQIKKIKITGKKYFFVVSSY